MIILSLGSHEINEPSLPTVLGHLQIQGTILVSSTDEHLMCNISYKVSHNKAHGKSCKTFIPGLKWQDDPNTRIFSHLNCTEYKHPNLQVSVAFQMFEL